jgi:hypothetical protein
MNRTLIGILFLIQICFISCLDKKDKQIPSSQTNLEEVLTDYLIEKKLGSIKYLVVIPNGGCSGCIDNSIKYLSIKLQEIDSIHVVFTQTKDKKLLKIQFGTENYYDEKVFIDSTNSELAHVFKSYVPMIYFIEKYKILKSTEFNEKFLE